MTDDQYQQSVLVDLLKNLQSFNKSLEDYNLPIPIEEDIVYLQRVTHFQVSMEEELQYSVQDLQNTLKQKENFNQDQKRIYEKILINIEHKEQTLMFIDARGGCGKTFLLNTVLAAVRLSEENAIAIASATTGIAAILLDLGGTMHSKLKIPIDISENSVLSITVKSKTAKTIQNAKLIIIDEGTMIDRFVLECIDRTFQDIMNNDLPFGN